MPPASAANHSSSTAAVHAAAKAEREEKLRGALKKLVLKERKAKQQEYAAKCEELRLRKEREARERENNLTLEETRDQIAKLDEKLNDLHNQKQQLFLQLKKVLNEDENRKKQQKDNELFAMQQAMQVQQNVATAQVFLPPVRMQHQQMPLVQKTTTGAQPVKRGRSPSPPQAYYKTANYGQQTKHDDRRGADYSRVLWNKPTTQYQNAGTLFYQTATTSTVSATQTDTRLQPMYPYQLPLRPGYHLELQSAPSVVAKTDSSGQKPTQIFHINLDQPPISQADVVGVSGTGNTKSPQITMEKISDRFHIEVKHDAAPTGHVLGIPHVAEGVIYKPMIGELALQPNVLQIATNLTQNPKSAGSITQGYAAGRPTKNDVMRELMPFREGTVASSRGTTAAVTTQHEQQLTRQQISVLPGQTAPPTNQQQLHYQRRLF